VDMQEMICGFTGGGVRALFRKMAAARLETVQEIRLRCDLPLMVRRQDGEWFVNAEGVLVSHEAAAYRTTARDIAATVEMISEHSLYAFEEEVRQGYITLPGGHRVGIVGRAVVENGDVRTLRSISGLHIRVAHAVQGCAGAVMPLIAPNGGAVAHTMILSPPGCGKTTLLRDVIRQLSNGSGGRGGVTVGVVDERSEIAGTYRGKAQNDVGIRTDVLDGCPKARGMLMLLRAMSPQVIAVDELGRREELDAIEDILNAGVRLVCTVHGQSLEEIARRPVLRELLDKRMFTRFIVLDRQPAAGHVAGGF